MTTKFLRRDTARHLKLGKRDKKKRKWRNPTGRSNKMRLKRKGYPKVVSVGYQTDKKVVGKIENRTPVKIMNVNDLKKVGKENIGVVGRVGKKRKLEIANAAKEMKVMLSNLNIKKTQKKIKLKTKLENKK